MIWMAHPYFARWSESSGKASASVRGKVLVVSMISPMILLLE